MTGLTASRPGLLILLVLGPLIALVWQRWPPPLPLWRRRTALGLRILLVALAVAALADVRVARRPAGRAVIAVVDLSDSARSSQEEAAAAVTALVRSRGPDDLFGVVTFGRDAQVELPPSRTPTFTGFQTRPDGSYSDVGGALLLAGNLIPDGYARQVLLVSDGRQNLGDAPRAVAQLRDRSVRVDVLPLGGPSGPEAAVLALDAPHEVRAGQATSVKVRSRSSEGARGTLTLLLDEGVAATREVELPPGASEHAFDLGVLEPGTHNLRAVLAAQPDGYAQNDTAAAVVKVLGRPSVLVLEGHVGAGGNVRSSLQAAGMDVEVRRSKEAPNDLAVLARYDAMVVADTAAESFPEGALAAMAAAVRDLGRGLVATGGLRAFGPGAWKGTPLEQVLPVRMDLPQPKQQPSVAVVLVLETMESTQGDGVALGAAQTVVDQLGPDDELAIINMRDVAEVVLPLSRLTDKAAAKQKLQQTVLGDPIGYSMSLRTAVDLVAASDAASKHVVLIADGDALGDVTSGLAHPAGRLYGYFGPYPDYMPVLAGARAAGVSVTAIGVDTHEVAGFMDHVKLIADAGGGAFYQSSSSDQVPEVLLAQTSTMLRSWYEQEPFFPKVASANDLLDGVALDAFPQLGGYVVTTPKPTADVLLTSPKGDPLLAAGRHGLGRAVAWTSDTEGRWTAGFLRSPVSGTLFGRMVAWTLPTGGSEPLRLDADTRGDGLEVTVTGPREGGDLQLQVVSPAGVPSSQELRPEAPGSWHGLVPTSDVGTHVIHAVLRRAGVIVGQAELSAPVPYSPEYLELGRDDGTLRLLASRSGAVLGEPGAIWSQSRLPTTVTSPIFWLLLLVAALLWPLDIALRRLTLGPVRLIAAIRAERVRSRKVAAMAPEPVVALRAGVTAARRAREQERAGDRRRAPVADPVPSGRTEGRADGPAGPASPPALAERLLEAKRKRNTS